MDIQVRAYGYARTAIGEKTLTLETAPDATVGSVLEELTAVYEIDDEDLVVMKDGRNIKQLSGLDTPLQEQSTLVLSLDSIGE